MVSGDHKASAVHSGRGSDGKRGPLVSVLLPTFNRPQYLSEALASVLCQEYRNLQVAVINDGGEDVSGLVHSFNDPRIVFINRAENRGKASSLNEALTRAQGKYVAYLDDDDLYYPHHITTLVDALENSDTCQVAYSDLYRTCCRVMPDGTRMVLSKTIEVSRDFERFVMLYFNHVLHVSLMHRRDMIEKTGPYNADLKVLIDWDMTRRLAFFSDFAHVHKITGEYYESAHGSDRISVRQRRDKSRYLKDALAIRTTRPAKPWPKIRDLSIILIAEHFDKRVAETIGLIWRYAFYPYKLYLPIPQGDFDRLGDKVPNMVCVPVDRTVSVAERLDAALAQCEGEFVAVVPGGFDVGEMWLEDSLYALINDSSPHSAYELEASTDESWAVVLSRGDLDCVRTKFPNLPLHKSLKAAGITLKRVRPEQIPFQFDQLLEQAGRTERNGDFANAAETFQYIGSRYRNELWMKTLAAQAFFKAERYDKAAQLAGELNQLRPTVDTLFLEARIKRRHKDFNSAIALLEKAEQILEGTGLVWT